MARGMVDIYIYMHIVYIYIFSTFVFVESVESVEYTFCDFYLLGSKPPFARIRRV